MNEEFPDPLLDAKLREVPLPEGLVTRLRATSVPTDGGLDQALREVPLPGNFQLRLQASLDAMIIDDALVDVPLPPDLLAKLHVIPSLREARPWRRMAQAACLMLVVGGLYGLTLGALINALRPPEAVADTLPLIDLGPLHLELQQSVAPVVHVTPPPRRPLPFIPPRAKPDEIAVKLIPFDRRIRPGAAGQMAVLLSPDFRLDADVFLDRWGALGAPHFGDPLQPDLEHVTAPRGTTTILPMVRGYDRGFWLKHNEQPPIWPANHPALRTSRLALTNRTDSVDLTRRRVAARRLPNAAEIRIEDFLAAVDYHFPRPSRGAVGIRTAAGPAIFAQQRHQLLQVAVQAGRARRLRTATHLAVALDISTSMGGGDRLEIAKQAIARLADQAGPDDYISLVAFHHDVVHLVESLNGEQLNQLSEVVGSLRATGGDNLVGGLQQAVSLLLASGLDDQFSRKLIVLTDGQNNLPPDASALALSILRVAAEHNVSSTFVQIGARADELPSVSELRDVRGTSWRQAETAREVQWELVEGLSGAPAAVADDPVLRVAFNPEAVQAYRLVGHGMTATSGLKSVTESTTLHNDEAATALYEVWLRPNNEEDVAWVQAQWSDPRTGDRHETAPRRVRRRQFATSVGEMPLSLQAAAVAAEIGKTLSGGFDFELSAADSFRHQKKTRDFRELAAACRRLNPSLETWAEFQDLMVLLAAMDKVHRNQTP